MSFHSTLTTVHKGAHVGTSDPAALVSQDGVLWIDTTSGYVLKIRTGSNTAWTTIATLAGTGLTDGDKGDIVVAASGTSWTFDSAVVTAFAKTFLDDANQAAVRTTLALTPGTDVQAYDADLAAIAALASAADKMPYATGSAAWALTDLSAFARTFLDDANAATVRATLGVDASGSATVADGDKGDVVVSSSGTAWTIDTAAVSLAKMADLAQDQFIGRTTASTGVPQTATITSAARTVLDDTTVGAMLTTMGGAPLASPTFTGTVTLPSDQALPGNPTTTTQSSGNSSTRVATTAFVADAVAKQKEVLMFALSDEATVIFTGTSVLTVRMPFAMTVTEVRSSVNTVSSSGLVTVDINEGGSTILSTKLSIDSSEKTSTTAATPAVISDSSLADDAEITFDIDAAGSGAKGLKVTLIGTRT